MPGRWSRIGTKDLAGGLNTSQSPLLIADNESPDLLNVEFDRASVKAARGSKKFNNQTAPRPGLLVGLDGQGATLAALPNKSVPVRGAVILPYLESQDIGADWAGIVHSGLTAPNDVTWHTQRGKSFDLQVSFKLPETTRFFDGETRGVSTTAAAGGQYDMKFGADQALDQFMALVQKGGDRLTPMSFALGIVNTGRLFDMDVGSGLNIFGLPTSAYAERGSNYALCVIWLDAPAFGIKRPVQARYRVDDGNIFSDEAAHVASTSGRYSTLAYRAFVVPYFIEPGRDYHVALRLSLDTGTPGASSEPGTGGAAVNWNNDGWIEVKAACDYEPVQTWRYDAAAPSSSNLFRYKGPVDSLDYLTRYGLRWHGRDAMFTGLGHRFAPWASAGFIPFGIDSAPVENGGFAITDLSAHGPVSSLYAERTKPEEEISATNIATALAYDLKIAHNPAQDATGTKFELNQRGFVRHVGAVGCTWGAETTAWPAIAAQGKLPWSPYNVEWSGLGGSTASPNSGFNAEALKSYRVVFATSSAGGFTAVGAAGMMLSIDQYALADAYAATTYAGASFTVEGGGAFLGGTHATMAAGFPVLVRAFRWDQQPFVISDLRIYSKPRVWSAIADYSLTHELDPSDTNDPGIEDLVGHWRFSDGGGRVVKESIASNHGFFLPLSAAPVPRSELGSQALFLSGEGEALKLDFADNPDLATQVREALRDGKSGFAVQVDIRETEAFYGLHQQIADSTALFGGGLGRRTHRFPPCLASWSYEHPERASADGVPIIPLLQHDTIDGWLSRPWPLLELSHAAEVEIGTGERCALNPMSFSLQVPSAGDQNGMSTAVPGATTTGLHPWYSNAGVITSRWDQHAKWVGHTISLQFGFHPTGVEDEYKCYIAGFPKEHLNPVAGEAPGAEFAYWTTMILSKRDVERSIITIGGSNNPKLNENYDATLGSWKTRGRSIWETRARLVVERVAVFACSAPGALPSVTGAITPTNSGKLVGTAALPRRPLEANDLLVPVGRANALNASRTLTGQQSVIFDTSAPADSPTSPVKRLLCIDGETLEQTAANKAPKLLPVTYFCPSATGSALTLSRPFRGADRLGVQVKALRAIAYTDLGDDLTDRELCVSGKGYEPATVRSSDALPTGPWLANKAQTGIAWRLSVFSSLSRISSTDVLPRWTRACTRSRANAIRGLHGWNEHLFAGAQGSLFELDDRWRPGPALAFLASDGPYGLVLPLANDRVELLDPDTLDLRGELLLGDGFGQHSVFDCKVTLDSVAGMRTIAHYGSRTSQIMQWWMLLIDGHPAFAVQSTEFGSTTRSTFFAIAERPIEAGVQRHIRFGLTVSNDLSTLQRPQCFVDGKEVSVTLSAKGVGAVMGPDPWLTLSMVMQPSASWSLLLGVARDRFAVPDNVRPPTPALANYATLSMHGGFVIGHVHALGGELSEFTVAALSEPSSNFTFQEFIYDAGPYVRLIDSTSEAVGHTVIDQATGALAVIYSHPFISLGHEFGDEDSPFAFADAENEVFVTNGTRLHVIEDE